MVCETGAYGAVKDACGTAVHGSHMSVGGRIRVGGRKGLQALDSTPPPPPPTHMKLRLDVGFEHEKKKKHNTANNTSNPTQVLLAFAGIVSVQKRQRLRVPKAKETLHSLSGMDVPAYGRSPPREEAVSFAEEIPFLVARHDRTHWIEDSNSGRGPNNVVAAVEDITPRKGTTTTTLPGEEEDDSLAVVFSSDTGAGRAHTPQRLNRTHTPQRYDSVFILTPNFKIKRSGYSSTVPTSNCIL